MTTPLCHWLDPAHRDITLASLVGRAALTIPADLVDRADLVDQAAHPAEAAADSEEAHPAEADSAEADSVAVVAAPGEAEAVGAAEAAADATSSARGRTYNRRPQRRQPSSLANIGLPSRNCPPPSGHSSRGVIGWVMRCGECETTPTEKR
jgi:hypothetical protein